jgi:hypothetical protein
MTNVDEVVREFVKASKSLRREWRAKPGEARKFLIRAGIIDKKGRLISRCR